MKDDSLGDLASEARYFIKNFWVDMLIATLGGVIIALVMGNFTDSSGIPLKLIFGSYTSPN